MSQQYPCASIAADQVAFAVVRAAVAVRTNDVLLRTTINSNSIRIGDRFRSGSVGANVITLNHVACRGRTADFHPHIVATDYVTGTAEHTAGQTAAATDLNIGCEDVNPGNAVAQSGSSIRLKPDQVPLHHVPGVLQRCICHKANAIICIPGDHIPFTGSIPTDLHSVRNHHNPGVIGQSFATTSLCANQVALNLQSTSRFVHVNTGGSVTRNQVSGARCGTTNHCPRDVPGQINPVIVTPRCSPVRVRSDAIALNQRPGGGFQVNSLVRASGKHVPFTTPGAADLRVVRSIQNRYRTAVSQSRAVRRQTNVVALQLVAFGCRTLNPNSSSRTSVVAGNDIACCCGIAANHVVRTINENAACATVAQGCSLSCIGADQVARNCILVAIDHDPLQRVAGNQIPLRRITSAVGIGSHQRLLHQSTDVDPVLPIRQLRSTIRRRPDVVPGNRIQGCHIAVTRSIPIPVIVG